MTATDPALIVSPGVGSVNMTDAPAGLGAATAGIAEGDGELAAADAEGDGEPATE
jgi:hypothetical protein